MIKRLLGAALAALLLLGHPAGATNLCALSITNAVTAVAQNPVTGFGYPTSLSVQAKFTYVASAATSEDLYVQTTIDGTTWFDIADFHFTTLSGWVAHNIVGAATLVNQTLSSGGLTSNTTVNGLLGSQFRCLQTSVGTYGAGTTISIDIYPRY